MQEWREVDEEDRGGDGWMTSRKLLQIWEFGWMDDFQEVIANLGVWNWKTMVSDRVQRKIVVRETKVHFGL